MDGRGGDQLGELEDVREELARAREDLEQKERVPLDHITDEDLYQVSLMRLQKRVRSLEAEERRMVAAECPCDGGEDCVC